MVLKMEVTEQRALLQFLKEWFCGLMSIFINDLWHNKKEYANEMCHWTKSQKYYQYQRRLKQTQRKQWMTLRAFSTT